jgi:hypothetical protein
VLVPFGYMHNLYQKANMTIPCSQCNNCKNCKCDGSSTTVNAAPAHESPAAAFREYLAANPSNLEARIYDV